MAISDELFLAILSMDAYNHGYDAGLGDTVASEDPDGLGGANTRVGWATIKLEDVSDAAKDSGFYALSYDWDGQTIISYRGTDGLVTDAIKEPSVTPSQPRRPPLLA